MFKALTHFETLLTMPRKLNLFNLAILVAVTVRKALFAFTGLGKYIVWLTN